MPDRVPIPAGTSTTTTEVAGGEGHEPHDQDHRRRLRRAPGLAHRLGAGCRRGSALMASRAKNFRRFKVRLHQERAEIQTLLATLQSPEPEPGSLPIEHPAEVAAALYDHEETLTLKGWLRQRLAEVDAALQRIRDGTYGRCEVCDRSGSAQREVHR